MALSRGGGGSGNSALSKRDQAQHPIEQSSSQHTPRAARGFCLLDTPESFWKNGYCPYDLSSNNTGQLISECIFDVFFQKKKRKI